MMSGGMGGMGGGMGMGNSLAALLGGMFGNSGGPYKDAQEEYQKWMQQAQGMQNPYLQGGQAGLGGMGNMLGQMSDPSGFINKLMGQYQQSPGATYQQQQGMRAAQNMGSASGLSGSTPLMQQAQQNAQGIASQDQNQWLQNVLGVNSQALNGYGNMAGMGQNAANTMSGLYGQGAQDMSNMRWNQSQGKQNDMWNMIGGGLGLGLGFFGM